jgi:acetate---CoA ligase (ADP-forming)
MIASARPESFDLAIRAVAGDPGIDAVLVIYVPPIVTRPLEVAQAIVRGSAAAAAAAAERGETPKPVLTCFMGKHGVPEGLRSLHEGQIPSYAFPESAAIALSRAVKYGRWRSEPEGRVRRIAGVAPASARAAIENARTRPSPGPLTWLTPGETEAVLDAYGIATVPGRVARDEDAAVAAAQAIGFPVVVKLLSSTVSHKSDVGGVRLNLRDEDEVREAWRRIRDGLIAIGNGAAMEGVLVQPMLTAGVEAIVGMSHDPSFGPLVMFGLGGVQVELLKDVAFRVQPLTDRDARELVRSVRSAPLLTGFRGAPPVDVAALEDVILRVSQLAGEHPEIVEMDLNPVRVLEPGRGCIVVDARIAVGR